MNKRRGRGKAFVDALVVSVGKTFKLSKIPRKYIYQTFPAMKYNDTKIYSVKSKGGRSEKYCLQHSFSAVFTYCKNMTLLSWKSLLVQRFLRNLLLKTCSPLWYLLWLWNLKYWPQSLMFAMLKSFRLHNILQQTKYFLKHYVTASREKPSIRDQI